MRPRSPNFQTETTTSYNDANMLSDQLLGNLEAKIPCEKNDNSFINNNNNQFIMTKHRINHMPLIRLYIERKHWRCVSYLIVVMIILALLPGVLMFMNFLLSLRNDHPKIEKQNYQPVKYIGIPSNVTTELNQVTNIFHVTKEFGLASMGGLGHIVTGLSQAQTANSALEVNVVFTVYQFFWNVTQDDNVLNDEPPPEPKAIRVFAIGHTVAELIAYITNIVDTPLFDTQEEHGVDIVHIHGTTNALVIEFLKDLNKENNRFDYTTEKPNYFHGSRMYTLSLAIDQADYVTFVSYTMAKEMVEGLMDFYLKGLIMPSILECARTGNWIGITSGIDLIKHYNNLVIYSKYSAKKHLIREGLLREDLNRVIVLFVGRFQYNKDVQFLHDAAQIISQLNAKFIIMGQHNSYPVEKVVSISKEYPDNVVVISDFEFQQNWGVLYSHQENG
ncbi:9025_t:CDS:2, partial [Entrophospora sp. SA101]